MNKSTKQTLLDQLSAPTITPDVLLARAEYWSIVAGWCERSGDLEQAGRIRTNCRAMEQQAKDMAATPLPSIVQRKAKAKAHGINAWRFWELHSSAVSAMLSQYGDGWRCVAPLGKTTLVSLPAPLRSAKTERGTVVRWGRDHRVPAAEYWPDGKLPDGLMLSEDPDRDVHMGPKLQIALRRAREDFIGSILARRENAARDWITEDYGRTVYESDTARARGALDSVRRLRAELASATFPQPRDAKWLKARGCVWRKGRWINRLEDQLLNAIEAHHRAQKMQQEAKDAIEGGLVADECIHAVDLESDAGFDLLFDMVEENDACEEEYRQAA